MDAQNQLAVGEAIRGVAVALHDGAPPFPWAKAEARCANTDQGVRIEVSAFDNDDNRFNLPRERTADYLPLFQALHSAAWDPTSATSWTCPQITLTPDGNYTSEFTYPEQDG